MAIVSLYIGKLMFGNYFWFFLVFVLLAGVTLITGKMIWIVDRSTGSKLDTVVQLD